MRGSDAGHLRNAMDATYRRLIPFRVQRALYTPGSTARRVFATQGTHAPTPTRAQGDSARLSSATCGFTRVSERAGERTRRRRDPDEVIPVAAQRAANRNANAEYFRGIPGDPAMMMMMPRRRRREDVILVKSEMTVIQPRDFIAPIIFTDILFESTCLAMILTPFFHEEIEVKYLLYLTGEEEEEEKEETSTHTFTSQKQLRMLTIRCQK